jgi:TonB-dependent siderophore receptor
MIATALTGGAMLASPVSALAQSPAATQQKAADYNIPAQDLSGALRQFAETSRLQLIYDAKATAGKQSAGVTGSLTPAAALSRILAGSGLGYAFSGTAVTIAPAAEATTAAAGPRVLAPVRVQGDDTGGSPVNGINGSRDVTATEGTGSYTSGALNIVSKMAQSIKDTPQSVSVITAQQISDQNLNDLTTALAQAPGITVINTSGSGPQQANFYSRGFQITTLQVDGGAPLDMQGQFAFSPNLDMSEYDSLQIVRGADGLFGGYGNPSGVIDLVRKKPLDHNQITTDTEIGSWNLYRETVDVSGPVTADKNLKIRAVASYQSNDYFYAVGKNNQYHLYANIEYDFSPNTYLNVGASYDQHRSVPNSSGIPSYTNGGTPALSTSECLCFPWNRDNTISTEAFAQLNHKFNKDWSVKLDLTYSDQSQYYYGGAVTGPITPTDPTATATAGEFQYGNTQYLVDLTVNGAFELFGHQQTLVVGGNYQNDSGPINTYWSLTFPGATPPSTSPSVNIYTFNPNSPQNARATNAQLETAFPSNGQEQYTLYANTKITPIDNLHILLGLRYSGYSYANKDQLYCGGFLLEFGICNVAGAPFGQAIVAKYSDTHFSWPIDASVIYDVTKDLSAYISYTDIYISNGQTLQLNGDPVAPETGYNEEIGLKWQAPNKKLNATLSLYNILQTNFPRFVSYGQYASSYGVIGSLSCCYTTGGRSELSQGVDIEVAGELAPGWNFSSSYSFDRTENKGKLSYDPGGPTYSQQPRNLFKLYTTYRFQSEGWLHRLSIGGGLNAQSTTTYSGYQYFMQQKPYALLSLRADYQVDKTWDLGLNIDNVTNTKYFQSIPASGGGGFYGQPMAYTLTLKSKW